MMLFRIHLLYRRLEVGRLWKESSLFRYKKLWGFLILFSESLYFLIMHLAHDKSIELIFFSSESNAIHLCFPLRTIHRHQSFDVSFMASLNSYYEQEVRKWLLCNPVWSVTIYQIKKLFKAAFLRAANTETNLRKQGFPPRKTMFFVSSKFIEKPMNVSDKTSRYVQFPVVISAAINISEISQDNGFQPSTSKRVGITHHAVDNIQPLPRRADSNCFHMQQLTSK